MDPTSQPRFYTYYEPEQLLRNVWFGRRLAAGHLDEETVRRETTKHPFRPEWIQKADHAFLAVYRRPPEPAELTTRYLVLLQQIAHDSTCYDHLRANADAAAAMAPRFVPRSVSPRRMERPRHHSVQMAPLFLLGVAALGAVAIGSVTMGVDVAIAPLLLVMTGGFVGLAVAAPMMRNAREVYYVCPECGCEYENNDATACTRCYLQFVSRKPTYQGVFGPLPHSLAQ